MMKSLLKMVMPLWPWMIAAVILGVFGFFLFDPDHRIGCGRRGLGSQ